MHVGRNFKQGAAVAPEEGFLCGGKVEDAEGFAGIVRGDGAEGGEGWIHGEAGLDDFLLGNAPAAHGFQGRTIGDEEVVGGGAEPGSIDFDRVGDDGEDGACGAGFLEAAFEKIRVDRIGGGDGVWLVFLHERVEVSLGRAHQGKVLPGEIALVGALVDFFPDPGKVGGGKAVGPLDDGSRVGGGEETGIGDAGFGTLGLKGESEITGGAVVPLTEGSGDD